MLMSSTKKCAAIITIPTTRGSRMVPAWIRRDRAAIRASDQHGTPDTGLIQHPRQHVQRPAVHVVQRPWQCPRLGAAVAEARVGEHDASGRRDKGCGETAPQ